MKTIKYVIAFVSVIFATACSNFSLDLAPLSQISDGNYWTSRSHFESFINGLHARLRTHEYNLFLLGAIRSDEYGGTPYGGESTAGMERFWLNTLNEESPGITNFAGFYTNINQINLFINKASGTDVLTEADKGYFLGQAYGLRAFYYFHLLRSWGPVIIWDEPSMSFDIDNLSKPAAPQSEVMDFIKSDLASSNANFGSDYSFHLNRKSFWNKAATLMLTSEVYLWSARQMSGGVEDADVAKRSLIEIQTNVPSLSLQESFEDVFAHDNKNNSEMIFTIHHQFDEATILSGNLNGLLPQAAYFESYYDSVENRRFSRATDLLQEVQRSMSIAISNNLYHKMDSRDTRKFSSIQGVFTLEEDGYHLRGCYLSKYKGMFDAGIRRLVDDYPVYRYADLLLLLAEAKAFLGEDIAQEINLVRERAYGSQYQASAHAYPNQPGDDNLDEMLLKERQFEFIGEGKRWYDLRRFGDDYVVKYTTATKDRLLWPIDINTLTRNSELKQTSGYEN